MKKTITIILLLTINIFYAQIQRLDGLISASETDRAIFSYDNSGNSTSTIIQHRDTVNDDWQDGNDGAYCFFDANNVITSTIIKESENYQDKTDYTYDTNGKISSTILAVYDWINNTWIENGDASYTYDTNGNLTEILTNYSDVTLSSGDQLSSSGVKKELLTYNSVNKKTSYKRYFQNNDGSWDLSMEEIYSYNSDDMLILIEQDATHKTELTYNTDGNLIEEVNSYLDEQTNNWTYSSKDIYSYDNSVSESDMLLPNSYILSYIFDSNHYTFNNKITNSYEYDWNSTTNDWDTNPRFVATWYYSDTALTTNNIDIHNYTVFPNPTTNQVKFDITDFEKIEIYDITGKLITKTETNIVNMVNVPNGTYLYRIQKGNETINGKIIKK